MTKCQGVYLYCIYTWLVNLCFYQNIFLSPMSHFSVSHSPNYILSVELGEKIFFMSGPWIVGRNIYFMSGPWVLGRNIFFHWNGFEIYFDWEYFLWLIRGSGILVPGKKDCYFSTIGGFLANFPLYMDVFLGLQTPAAYNIEHCSYGILPNIEITTL